MTGTRSIFIASLIGLTIVASAALVSPAKALTVDDIQSQLKVLLSRFSQFQMQGGQATTSAQSDIAITALPRICKILPPYAVALGARGEAVTGLQEFLRAEGYLNAQATGYFGLATKTALAQWQSAQGLSSVGIVGPMTREAIRARCGTANALSVYPQSGTAPLTVTIKSQIGDGTSYQPSMADGQDTLIDFGDGSPRQWVNCETIANDQFGGQTAGGRCKTPASFTHTYTKDGTYTVSLVQAGGMCMGGCPERLVASAYVTVGQENTNSNFSASPSSGPAPLDVSFAYQPSEENGQYYIDYGDGTGEKMTVQQIYCIRAPCISPATAKHTYTQPGAYTATVSRYIACLYSNPRCMIAQPAPLASVQVNVTGTAACKPINYMPIRCADGNPAQPVKDANGCTTGFQCVNEKPTVCTKEYKPVCGRPSGCANTCPSGMYCTMMCRLHDPVTYGNSCELKAAGAEYLYDGACKADTQ